MIELKPCPFCGGAAKATAHFNGGTGNSWEVVECTQCGVSQPVSKYYSHKQAIAAWNRRAEPENKPLTLEQVTERRGKPLWYQPITDGEDTPFDINPEWFICNPDKLPEPFYLYGKTWLAYAQEPVSK
ncbi:MAG: Lar family restriction alleviation protein [Oscillospiraceae bacterium]|jgi:Lar family restriction alleviation protein